MGKIFKGILVLFIIMLCNVNVKAEQKIYLVIPDEIKKTKTENSELCKCCKECKCDGKNCECDKIGDFEDYTEIENTLTTSEILALQKIALSEANDIQTMAYIMQTVINRKRSSEFPDNVEDIIKQKGQFSTYPDKYEKAIPNGDSEKAFELLQTIDNKNQLFFENTVSGSWQSTHKEFVFKYGELSFYK